MAHPTLATELRRLRLAAGLSSYALAKRAGIDPSYVTHLEKGNRQGMSDSVAVRLAHALHLDPTVFRQTVGLDTEAPPQRMSFEHFVATEPTLDVAGREVLLATYRAYIAALRGESLRD